VNAEFGLRSCGHKLVCGSVLVTSLAALLVTGVAMLIYDLRSYHTGPSNDLTTRRAHRRGQCPPRAVRRPQVRRRQPQPAQCGRRYGPPPIYNAKGGLFASYLRPGAQSEDLSRRPPTARGSG